MKTMQHRSSKDFSKSVVKALAARGITFHGTTWLPAASGALPCANGETGYQMNDNGTMRIRTYREVIALAA